MPYNLGRKIACSNHKIVSNQFHTCNTDCTHISMMENCFIYYIFQVIVYKKQFVKIYLRIIQRD